MMTAMFVLLMVQGPVMEDAAWRSFKPGSWVKIETDLPTKHTMTYTLLEVAAGGCRISYKREFANGFQDSVETTLPIGDRHPAGEAKNETIEAAGKSFVCTVRQEGYTSKGEDHVVWRSEEAPGEIVKETLHDVWNGTGETIRELDRLSERRSVAGKELDCWLMRSTKHEQNQNWQWYVGTWWVTGKEWRSREIPGWLAHAESTTTRDGKSYRVVQTVVAFEVKP